MRLVLDTDVMVAALCSRTGASRALLRAALDRRVSVLASTTLFVEYEATLTRPDILSRSGLSAHEVRDLLDDLADLIVPVAISYRWRPVARDPGDDMVVETAINGVADAIATFNHRDMASASRFGVEVLLPATVLRRIE